jgi:uncharacterized membrane protein
MSVFPFNSIATKGDASDSDKNWAKPNNCSRRISRSHPHRNLRVVIVVVVVVIIIIIIIILMVVVVVVVVVVLRRQSYGKTAPWSGID